MRAMKSGVPGPFLLLLLLLLSSGVSGLGSVLTKYYSYVLNHITWKDAQSYCRSTSYTDLATIYTQSDTDVMYMDSYLAWIGLYRSTQSTPYPSYYEWLWVNGQKNDVWAWAQYEPQGSDNCAVVHSNKKFYGTNCGSPFFFTCQKKKGDKYEYTPVALPKTWSEAQQYCMDKFEDLAILNSYADLDSAVTQLDFPAWIGLHQDGGAWKWSTGLSDYRHWASGEPGNSGDCVSISSLSKKMSTQNCSSRFPFVCFKDNLVLIRENKTWEEALIHCQSLRSSTNANTLYQLVSIQPGEEHSQVTKRITTASSEQVWAGLRFLAGHWLWVNGADMLYAGLPSCPLEGQHCGALSKNDTGSMETADCSAKLNFLCYSTP